jgi:hypothetical protein
MSGKRGDTRILLKPRLAGDAHQNLAEAIAEAHQPRRLPVVTRDDSECLVGIPGVEQLLDRLSLQHAEGASGKRAGERKGGDQRSRQSGTQARLRDHQTDE